MTVEISIDRALCRGHQMCVLGSPGVFVSGDDEDGLAEVAEPRQPAARIEELRRTAAGCPEAAISITDSQEGART